MFEFEEFKKEVIGTYRDMLLHHELDTRLEHPTPGNLRNLSLKLYANGLSKEDIQVFQDFFNPTNKYADLETGIRRFELDKLKPLKNFIMAKTSNPDENIVKLLAILIQFSPRPFHKWRQLRHQKNTVLPEQLEHKEDKNIKIKTEETYERIAGQPVGLKEGGMIEIDNRVDENQDIQQHREEKKTKERLGIKSNEKGIRDSLIQNSDFKNQHARRYLTNRYRGEKVFEIKPEKIRLADKWIGIHQHLYTKKNGFNKNSSSGLHQKKIRSSSNIYPKEDWPFPQDSFSMIQPAVAAKSKKSDPFKFEMKHLFYLLILTFCMIVFCITTYFVTSKLRMCWIEVQYVTADYPRDVEQKEIVPINQAQFRYFRKITAPNPTISTIPTNRVSYPTSNENVAAADSTALPPIAVQDSIKPTPHYVILLYADENHTEASIRKKFRSDPPTLLNK
ncbi:hypothetical protein SF1_13310 [Sphingobacterium faecium NBRC 15299]|uniref:hypothetical protein n=1 Tax=Sphingobacterium faecium TaxID=34087 RepID=UPI000D38AF6B|nr:hypothetical protein [Sphingobacterium faecium]PTX11879.1 hypothetical protein C8N37_103456 [Sphingobacterium faecium]GEM63349.1 hypothetical protein SF1_13310 [Sphingobacterium faecium NBRC 15299]